MSTLYLVDGNYYFFSSYFAPMKFDLTSPTGFPTKACHIFTGEMFNLLTQKKPSHLAVAFDSKEAPTWRKKVCDSYKGNRSGIEDDTLDAQFQKMKEILRALQVPVLEQPGYEADDIIGTLTCMGVAEGYDVVISTKDKDVFQLMGDIPVTVWEMKSDVVWDSEAVHGKFGVWPHQFIDFLALQGDSSDNIPGVRGIGPKKAQELLSKYNTLDGVYENIEELPKGVRKKLHEGIEDVRLSKQLVKISLDVPLGVGIDDLAWSSPDMEACIAIFDELGLSKQLVTLLSHWRCTK